MAQLPFFASPDEQLWNYAPPQQPLAPGYTPGSTSEAFGIRGAPATGAQAFGLSPMDLPPDPRISAPGSARPGVNLIEALKGTSWGHAAQGAYDLAQLPGDVGSGRVDPFSEEGLNRAIAGAFQLTLGNPAGAVARNAGEKVLGSTMIDPLMHGSRRAGLTELTPSVRGPLGPGVYTTPAPNIAGRYAGEGGTTYTLPQVERDVYRGHGHRTDAEYAGFKQDKERLLAAAEPENRAAIEAILEKTWGEGYPMYARLRGDVYKGDEGAQALFKRAGFEGLSGNVDGPEVLLFNKQPLAPLGAHVAQ